MSQKGERVPKAGSRVEEGSEPHGGLMGWQDQWIRTNLRVGVGAEVWRSPERFWMNVCCRILKSMQFLIGSQLPGIPERGCRAGPEESAGCLTAQQISAINAEEESRGSSVLRNTESSSL